MIPQFVVRRPHIRRLFLDIKHPEGVLPTVGSNGRARNRLNNFVKRIKLFNFISHAFNNFLAAPGVGDEDQVLLHFFAGELVRRVERQDFVNGSAVLFADFHLTVYYLDTGFKL